MSTLLPDLVNIIRIRIICNLTKIHKIDCRLLLFSSDAPTHILSPSSIYTDGRLSTEKPSNSPNPFPVVDFWMETLKRNTGANCKRRHHEKRHWTPDENYLLIMLVKKHGPANWDFIAEHIKGRTGNLCLILSFSIFSDKKICYSLILFSVNREELQIKMD